MPTTIKKTTFTQIEKELQTRYQKEFGGKIEYPTKFGKIDLLTDTTIFEFKRAKNYKETLGQLLSYQLCVPQNRMVAVFFDTITIHRCDIELLMLRYGIETKFVT